MSLYPRHKLACRMTRHPSHQNLRLKRIGYDIFLLYKCPGLKSKDFKSQEKRERKIGKSVGVHAVGGGGADVQKE